MCVQLEYPNLGPSSSSTTSVEAGSTSATTSAEAGSSETTSTTTASPTSTGGASPPGGRVGMLLLSVASLLKVKPIGYATEPSLRGR